MTLVPQSTAEQLSERLYVVISAVGAAMIGLALLFIWQWFKHHRRSDKREERRLALEEKRIAAATATATNLRNEVFEAANAGLGSGGYIVMDMPEEDRPLFHDLLKGFEDYVKLKGYTVAFSIDTTFDGRIGFKFTVKMTA